ncbi:RagB/SusD family nutrient uptake outer membrane protein [Pedobacter sp. GR22-10]|uniref:RagB/SusD family nutrient uptake outer membrane protein n=1 Tax=Pedobacter sp. GR22-10 TaxID=2994472 RepID=UPI002245565A|nr:RagB/SusD family nutrient uptake outer membrane protein [Pedobacter sp. GR22-10]MCX2430138.1 RagB/SusD family nutrient uptake outer membrane protein [Pedobacter sp. GR22-10]
MKNINIYIGFIICTITFNACKKDFLEREPQSIVVEDQVYGDPKLIEGVLANLYNRIPTDASLTNRWTEHTAYDDAVWSGSGNAGDEYRNNIISYPVDRWRLWDYGFIRDVNLGIEGVQKSTKLTAQQKAQFNAEFRFLRAYDYFEMVKRMGGVPLVTTPLVYDYSGDATNLQLPRSKEVDVYDFIGTELDAIVNHIENNGSTSRANKYAVLALKCRAMLYAGSLAKYNNMMASPITLPGGEVGIPAQRAADFYNKALDAAKQVIAGPYSLYKSNAANLGENFYEALTKKTGNPELILIQDFLQSKGFKHGFSYDNIARSLREDNLASSAIAPTLNLVEKYEYLDGTAGNLKTRNADNSDYVYYTNTQDIFANKDARLYGTIIYPGTSFRNTPVNIQAGVALWNGTTYQIIEGDLGARYTDGKLLTGLDGPQRSALDLSNTGFYLRKFIDNTPLASTRTRGTDIAWIRFRLGEVYLNAAEAAFELGQTASALSFMNTLRERAGFGANSLSTLTIDRIRNERRVELAFEDHRVWDLARWRIADQVWNGSTNSPDAMLYALYPYRVVRPGDAARHDKYIFIKQVAPRFKAPRFYQIGNYYSSIEQAVLNNNPKIIRNPFH